MRSQSDQKNFNQKSYKILFEDQEILWICKEAGLIAQGALTKDKKNSLPDLIKKGRPDLSSFLAPINRLDRNVSGVMMFAKTSTAAKKFQALLKKGKIKKTYVAYVLGDPGKKGSYKHLLRKDSEQQKARVFDLNASGADLKEVELRFEMVKSFPLGATNCSKIEIELLTGRYHQIRAQFSFEGYPLLGDPKYGSPLSKKLFYRPALHAQSLRLEKNHECSLPKDLQELEKHLKNRTLERSL